MQKCEYECGSEAAYFNKRKKIWCCSPKATSCPAVRLKNSERQREPSFVESRRQAFRDKYGVDHQMHLPSVKEKVESTNLTKYGVSNPGQSELVRNKIKATNLERYGVEETFSATVVKDKIKETLNERYGGHHMLDNNIQQKVSRTLLDRYGVSNPGQTESSRIQASKPKSDEFRSQVAKTWAQKTKADKDQIIQKRFENNGFRTPFEFGENRSNRSISKKEIEWLDSLGIPTMLRQHRFEDLHMVVDGFDPLTNTVYLFHGDFWHGNPEIFLSEDVNPRTKTTFGSLYENTLKYESVLKDNGFILEIIWESEYDRSVRNKNRT